MKARVMALAAALCFMSCDYILKDSAKEKPEAKPEKKVTTGTDKDKFGCVTSAGYRWCAIKNGCIRIFEEGYRLNPVETPEEGGNIDSAFVIFEENGDRAELYLPDGTNGIVLKREVKDGPYLGGSWSLHPENGYTVKKDGQPAFIAAKIDEDKVTGDDKQQS